MPFDDTKQPENGGMPIGSSNCTTQSKSPTTKKRENWYVRSPLHTLRSTSRYLSSSPADPVSQYTHWTGRRARNGSPLFLFEIKQLTPSVMASHEKSCSSRPRQPTQTVSEAMLRLFCTYENLIRFVLPLCSAVKARPEPESPVTDTTCIVDISGVSLMQFWRLRSHMQAASALATSHYPETLGRTYVRALLLPP